MDVNKLFKNAMPYYCFPELLPYLRDDLMPGLGELLSYTETQPINPDIAHGLTTRITALYEDLMNALAGVHAGETAIGE
jgi:hypothetical protein